MTVLRRRGEKEDEEGEEEGREWAGHNDGHAAITRAVRFETAHNPTRRCRASPSSQVVIKCLHDGKPGIFHP